MTPNSKEYRDYIKQRKLRRKEWLRAQPKIQDALNNPEKLREFAKTLKGKEVSRNVRKRDEHRRATKIRQ